MVMASSGSWKRNLRARPRQGKAHVWLLGAIALGFAACVKRRASFTPLWVQLVAPSLAYDRAR